MVSKLDFLLCQAHGDRILLTEFMFFSIVKSLNEAYHRQAFRYEIVVHEKQETIKQ